MSPPIPSSMIFQCHGLWITPSFGRRGKRASGFCKMLVRAPRHGKMTSASTVGRSRCNQPSLWSYIDCFTTAGWTLDVCHFRAYKESAALAEIMLHSGGSKKNPGCRTLSVAFQSQDGPSFSKRIYFTSPYSQHAIEYHVASVSLRPLLHAPSHLYTSKGCQHVENRAQDKSTSLINIIECI